MSASDHPTTPDGRYFIVAGRLWRSTNPEIPEARRHRLVVELMHARQAVKKAKGGNGDLRVARARVDTAKVALGERGPVWWDDGAPDLNRHMAKTTLYAEWAGALERMRDRASGIGEAGTRSQDDSVSRTVNVTTRVGRQGPFRVDLPLDPGTLNERLFDIGLWLVERKIPHLARVLLEPDHDRLRISFPDAEDARAFRVRFGARLN